MHEMEDMALVEEYAATQADAPFATLVERHLNLVYSAALRQVRNPQLAEEVTQVVFTILAQKAARLREETVLSGWLYRTTRFAAMTAIRTEQRRHKYEQEIMQMQPSYSEPEPDIAWEEVAPLLDEAMNDLGEKDRNAVVLHFFEKKNFHEVGEALGTNDDAAQKRVSRAVEKLRGLLRRRNVMAPVAALGALLSAQGVQAAPGGLAASISASAILKANSTASILTLTQETVKLMASTKTKTSLIAAVVLLLAFGTITAVLYPAIMKKARRPQLEGAWEGALGDKGRMLRLVLKVSRKPDAAYSATLDSVDQGAGDIPVSDITYSNATVRITIKSLSGNFNGEMNPSGSQIAGTWQQLGMTFPLTLRRTDKPTPLGQPLAMSAYTPRAGSDLQGYWVGNLASGEARLLRLALKISEPADGTFNGVFDLIDQGLRNLPVASINYDKPYVSFDMVASKAHFEGELNAWKLQLLSS